MKWRCAWGGEISDVDGLLDEVPSTGWTRGWVVECGSLVRWLVLSA